MKKEIWLLGVLGLIMVILLCILFFVPAKKTQAPQPTQNKPVVVVEGIQIISPKLNEEVASPIKISGIVTGNGWSGFEGQVGVVEVRDLKGMSGAVLKAMTDWTVLPTSFEATVTLNKIISGPITLVFHNENPSGDPAKDKTFSLPIKIK